MRYRQLPFIAHLTTLAAEQPAEAIKARNAAANDLVATSGFQLIISILQATEASAMDALRAGIKPEYQLGRMAAIQALRNGIGALLTVPDVDWHDDAEEDVLPEFKSEFSIPL